MHFKTISTIAVIGLLTLSGCADSSNDDADQSTSEDEATQTQSQVPTEESETSETEQAESPAESSSVSETSKDPKESKLTLSTDSDEVAIEPTDVYCSGSPGNIDHIIGKTNNELPLVKAEKKQFVMVKTGHGRPYKTNEPNGIDYGDKSVSFDKTKVGTAVLNGTMDCTEWED